MRHFLIFLIFAILSACGGSRDGGGGDGGGGGGLASSTSPTLAWDSASASTISAYKTSEYNSQYGLNQINAAEAYAALETNSKEVAGGGITIAVVDTGVQTNHVEISGNYTATGSYDFVNDDSDPSDDQGHGTHVSSIAAGVSDGSGIHGVAYESNIVAIKVLDSSSRGSISDVASGITQAATAGADIINLSLGSGSTISEIKSVMVTAAASDVLMVAATGNRRSIFDNLTQAEYPARYASDSSLAGYVLAVASVDSSSSFSSFSHQCGDAMNYCLAAPGEDIYAAGYSTTSTSNYEMMSGTSMSTPHVAGAAAVIRGAWPFLTAPEVTQILLTTATDLGALGVDTIYGHGLLNLYAAVQAQGQNTLGYGTSVYSGGYSVKSSSLISDPIFGDAFALNVAPQLNSAIFFDDYGRDYKAFLGNKISARKVSSLSDLSSMAFNNYSTKTIPLSFGKNSASQLKFQVKSYSESSAPNQLGLKYLTVDKSKQDVALAASNGFSFAQNFNKNFQAGFSFNRDEIANSRGDTFANFGFISLTNIAANPFQSFVSGVSTSSGNQRNFNQFFITNKFLGDKFTLNFSQQSSYESTSIVSRINNIENRISDLNAAFSPNSSARISLSLGNLNEFNNNILNSKALGAFESEGSSKTSYFKISASQKILGDFSVISSFSEGTTIIKGNSLGIFRSYSNVRSRSSSLGLVNENIWGGKVGLIYLQPLRVYSGKANINIPTARDFDGNLTRYSATVSLKPQGRQQDLELFYAKDIAMKNLSDAALKFNLIAQKQPSNIKSASNNYLGFVSFGGRF